MDDGHWFSEIVLDEFSSNACGNGENDEEMGSCKVLSYVSELDFEVLSLKIIEVEFNLESFR